VPDLDRLRVFRTVAGDLIWLRETISPDHGPDIVRVDPRSGQQTPVIAGPGDENIQDVSPDGAWILFGADDQASPHYDQGIHIARIDGSESRRLSAGRASSGWSPDGRYLGALAVGQMDTLFVLTPAGRVLASRTGQRIDSFAFCGAGDRIALTDWTDEGPRLLWWDWRTGGERARASDVSRLIGCSPDGTAALVGFVRDRTERIGVLDFQTGEFHDVGLDPVGTARVAPTWLADHRPPVPSSLRLVPDRAEVNWGGADSLSGQLTLSDGSTDTASVVWSAADSSVATVAASGTLRGNRPGSTIVRGCVDDWICDSIRVVVTGETTADQLFEGHFSGALDTTQWIPFGRPVPRTVNTPENERVLFLNGDGVWVDGILSRDRFTLHQGATLELEFRYRTGLHRTDRQTAMFCLVRYDLPPGPPAALDQLEDGRIREQICFSYPADQLERFDPQVAVLSHWPGYTSDYVRAATDFPPVDWTHLAIQVRADGSASLIVNHRQVKELRVRLTGAPLDDWRVLLAGHSVDARLEVRHVTLWRGTRY
jgi:hypothetical protein